MKKITLLALFVLLFSYTQLYAQPKEKTVVVGTFAEKQNADRALKRLREFFDKKPELVELKKSANLRYVARKSGYYYIVAIEPIIEYDVLNTILSAARDIFADSFVNIMSKKIEVETTDDGYSPEEAQELGLSNEEPLATIENEEDSVEETTDDNSAVDDDSADESIEDSVEKDSVTQANTPQYVQKDTEKKSFVEDENFFMYVGVGIVLLLIIIIVMLKRRKSPSTVYEESEEENLSNIILDDTLENSVDTDNEAETSEIETTENNVLEETEETEEEIVEPEVKKIVSRKIREKFIGRGKIQKSDFNKFSGARILIAEDNLINQKVIKGLLADSGMDLVIAEDGQIALDILRDDKNFHMVLMDAHMPNVDGFEATRAIRADESLEHIPVIALSGDTSIDDIRKMNDAGMEETLEKPLKMDSLYDVFYCFLDLGEKNNDQEDTEKVISTESEDEIVVEEEVYENSVIDHEVGLEIAGDEELYQEIMDEFASMYHESDTKIFELIQEDNFIDALALLLDIQGLAGSIGAGELYECATMYRVAIQEGSTEKMEKMQNKYSKEFSAVLTQIEAHKA